MSKFTVIGQKLLPLIEKDTSGLLFCSIRVHFNHSLSENAVVVENNEYIDGISSLKLPY